MKAIKTLVLILFCVGFIVVAGTIGADDYSTMILHQQYSFQIWRAIAGMMLMVPAVLVGRAEIYGS